MPGYIIHIATAKAYSKEHNIECSNDFIKGVISPDLTNDKSKTHYGKSPAYTNLKKYLESNNATIDNDYELGIFLHLIADYLFYNKYLDRIKKPDIYEDYDKTNKILIDKYNIKIPEEIKDVITFKEGDTSVFTIELIEKLIDEISKIDINKVITEVLEDNIKWNTYKKLV